MKKLTTTLLALILVIPAHVSADVGFNDIVKALNDNPEVMNELVTAVRGMALGMAAANLKVTTMKRTPIWCMSDSQMTRVSSEANAIFDRMVELNADRYAKENTHLVFIMSEAFDTYYPCQ